LEVRRSGGFMNLGDKIRGNIHEMTTKQAMSAVEVEMWQAISAGYELAKRLKGFQGEVKQIDRTLKGSHAGLKKLEPKIVGIGKKAAGEVEKTMADVEKVAQELTDMRMKERD